MNDRHITELDELEAQLDHAIERLRAIEYRPDEVRSEPYRQMKIDEASATVGAIQYKIQRLLHAQK